MIWKAREHHWNLSNRALIMGIVNVTPDSFSDGGQFIDASRAVDHALSLVAEGADIIDIGGESTRPGAAPVAAKDERRRVLPVIERLRAESAVAISIDTSKADVARAAVESGADIINDVTALSDPNMSKVAATTGAGLVLMHMQGEPRTMQAQPHYENVTSEVRLFLEGRRARALDAGVPSEYLAFDPGIGFGKSLSHNLQLLRELEYLLELGPLLVGVSRKSFIGKVLGSENIVDREWPTIALTSYAVEMGARILRVHDVKRNAQASRMTEAILGAH